MCNNAIPGQSRRQNKSAQRPAHNKRWIMGTPVNDDDTPEYRRYAPKWVREQTPMGDELPDVAPTPTLPSTTDIHQHSRTRFERDSWPEAIQQPSRYARSPTLIGQIVTVASAAAVVALLFIFAKPLWQGAGTLLNEDSRTPQASKRSDRISANNPPANSTLIPAAAGSRAEPSVSAQAQQAPPSPAQTQQAALSPSPNSPALGQEARSTFRGVTDSEIRFGISAAMSGPTKELGQNMQRGIVAAFNAANASGGVHGRQLRLFAADDGYEPARAAETMKQLYEREQVFGVVGNVGTPTAVVALPYALERKMLFFGAFTGAGLLRNDPPDRYVFNYRASYAEETAAVVNYLVKVRHIKPTQIAVFAQQDSYGDAGVSGVAKAMRALGGNDGAILRLGYQRNTIDVEDAVDQLRKNRIPIRAVIMVPTYRAAAKFIEKTRDA